MIASETLLPTMGDRLLAVLLLVVIPCLPWLLWVLFSKEAEVNRRAKWREDSRPRRHIATPSTIEINVPNIVIYYDHECHIADGNGWCVDVSPVMTYRFDTLASLTKWMKRETHYLHNQLHVRCV